MTKNHFSTLGLTPSAGEDEVKKAYKTLAKKWHPDKNKDEGAEEKFKEIAGAYEYLKSEDRRQILERDLNRPKQWTSSATNGTTDFKSSKETYGESSSWSRKFGQSSENTYTKSTFGHFADEGKSPGPSSSSTKKPEAKSNRKKRRPPKQKSAPSRKTWQQDWDDTDDSQFYDIPAPPPPRQEFSFAFQSFVDDLGMNFNAFFMGPGQWEYSAFTDGTDPFSDFYTQGTFSSLATDGFSRPRPRKRNVAPERTQNGNGLDSEYMFTPRTARSQFRSHTSFSNKENNTMFGDNDTTQYYESDDDMDSRLFKCTYCEKRMPFSTLSTHEPGCALRKGGQFDTSDDEGDNFPDRSFSPEEDQYPSKTSGDWRQNHENLLHNIRRAKQAARVRPPTNSAPSSSAREKNSKFEDEGLAQIKCKWCGRTFSHPTAKAHIPFCEKWTKEHGTPLNPVGKPTARDQGSKSHRAREYAKKHVPKPTSSSHDDQYDSDSSPRSPRSHYDNINFAGMGMKRPTLNKQTPSSGTGLHASTSPQYNSKESSPGPSVNTSPRGYSQRHKTKQPTSKTTAGTPTGPTRFTSPGEDTTFSNKFTDSYGFGLHGSKIRTETRSQANGTCLVCKKKYGAHGRLLCNCGIRKTGS